MVNSKYPHTNCLFQMYIYKFTDINVRLFHESKVKEIKKA